MSAFAGEHNSNWCWSSDTDAVQLKVEEGDADSAPFSSMVREARCSLGFSLDYHCNTSHKSVLLTSHKPISPVRSALAQIQRVCERRDIRTSCSKLIAAQTKDGDSDSLPGVLNSSTATCVVTVPRDPASFVDRISSGTRRTPNWNTQPHRGDRPRLGDGRRGVEEDQTKRLQTCSGTSLPVDENLHVSLTTG